MSKHRNIRNAKRLVKSGILNKEATIIRKTRCFKQVAAVIGPKAAMRELLRVVRESDASLLEPHWASLGLLSCFAWLSSPQGHKFWMDIHYSQKFPH